MCVVSNIFYYHPEKNYFLHKIYYIKQIIVIDSFI